MIEPVSNEASAELLRKFGKKTESEKKAESKNGAAFDVSKYLQEHGIEVIKVVKKDDATFYQLKHCIFDSSHMNNDAAVVQADSGMLSYKCFHDSCQGKPWKDARKIISGDDPLYGDARARSQGEDISVQDAELRWINRETLKNRPPEAKYLFEINGQGLIPKGTVGAIVAAGGTGKSFLLAHLGVSLASGQRCGPITPLENLRVMILNAEDDTDEIGRRIWDITRGNIPYGIELVSVCGVVKTIMALKDGNPVNGDGFAWIERILSEKQTDVLILDPFSRFYGLDECNSSHGTAWVSALENLRSRYGLTNIITAHHSNEASQQKSGRMDMTMLRGNSAFVNGYRFAIGMRKMAEADAKIFGIEADRKSYVEIDDLKRNQGKSLQHHFYLHQNDQTGIYEAFNPERSRMGSMADALVNAIEETGAQLSRRELREKAAGKEVSGMVADSVSGYIRSKDMDRIIDYCLKKGWLIESEIEAGKTTKKAIMRDNGAKTYRRQTPPKNDLAPLSAYNDSELTPPKDFDANENFGADNINDFNMITPPKNHLLKEEGTALAPFSSSEVFGALEDCLECTARHDRGEKKYCIEHVDHDSRMRSDTPCDQARPQCRGPHKS